MTLDDYTTGDIVCTKCGLVLDRTFGGGGELGISPCDTVKTCGGETESSFANRHVVDGDWSEFIRRVCTNHPWLDELVDDSVQYFSVLVKDDRVRTACRQDLAAFAIYKTARAAGCGMLPKLVASTLGSDAKHLLRLERIFDQHVSSDDACYYLAGMTADLGLSRKEFVQLESLVKKLDGKCFGKQPRTIAAAMIYLFKVYRHHQPKYLHRTLLGRLSKMTGVSVRSIVKAVSHIETVLPCNVFLMSAAAAPSI